MAPPAKIVHQTWKGREIPAGARRLVRSWRDRHPHWEYRLWTDEENRDLVARFHPELLAVYDAYPHGVQRADAARLAILHRHGGLYVDLDVECLDPVDDLFPAHAVSLIREPAEQALVLGESSIVSNAVIAAPAGHPLLRRLLDELANGADPSHRPSGVLDATGPIFLTRALERIRPDGVHWLPTRSFFPVSAGSPDLDRVLAREPGSERCVEQWRRRGTRGVHYWVNTWARDLQGELRSAESAELDGFVFHAGWDSPGFDLERGGRDVQRLAAACRERPEAVAFNTDGWLKYHVPKPSWWRRMRWVDSSQGLYVKSGYGTLARWRSRFRRRTTRTLAEGS